MNSFPENCCRSCLFLLGIWWELWEGIEGLEALMWHYLTSTLQESSCWQMTNWAKGNILVITQVSFALSGIVFHNAKFTIITYDKNFILRSVEHNEIDSQRTWAPYFQILDYLSPLYDCHFTLEAPRLPLEKFPRWLNFWHWAHKQPTNFYQKQVTQQLKACLHHIPSELGSATTKTHHPLTLAE